MSRFKHAVGNYISAYRLSTFAAFLDSVRSSRSNQPTQFDPTQTPAWFQTIIANRRSSAALREHLAEQPGEERLEFLLVYVGFTRVANALQRFEHLRTIIHRFVREGAERYISLSPESQQRVLREWAPWNGSGRVPADARFPYLEEAAHEVHRQLAGQGRYGQGIREWLARYSEQLRVIEVEKIDSLGGDSDSVTVPLG